VTEPLELYDVVVTGGGPVGAAAALELHARGARVLLLEAREPASEASPDGRPLALSYGSRLILERLAVWPSLATGASAIQRIHVSQQGRFGRTVLSAADAGLPALGYVVDYGSVLAALEQRVFASGVSTLRGARVTSVAHDATTARVNYETAGAEGACLAPLVAVADGSAESLGAEVRVIDYGQSAITARVSTAIAHGHTAYERFTPEGPLALLPAGGGFSIVWTTRPARGEWLCAAQPGVFLRELQRTFGDRAGRFTAVSARTLHRVSLRVAKHASLGHAVMLGNASQSLHPVAGQGFNLGLRDAWELAEEVSRRGARDPALPQAYRARRRIDRGGGIALTHTLVKVFSNDSALIGVARGAGLTLLDSLPPAKNFFMRRMEFGARG